MPSPFSSTPSRFVSIYGINNYETLLYGTANDAFTFLGSSAPTAANANGALWFSGGILYASVNTNVAAEFSIALTNLTTMTTTNFIL